jgi:hypothetical protein
VRLVAAEETQGDVEEMSEVSLIAAVEDKQGW